MKWCTWGVCGGACCAGKYYWCQSIISGGYAPGTQLELFNFFLGVSLRYDAGLKVDECNTEFIDEKTFQITGGAGLAVLITSEDVCASSFSSCKNGKWGDWCKTATARHQDVLKRIASNVLGPWWPPPPTTAASDESADEPIAAAAAPTALAGQPVATAIAAAPTALGQPVATAAAAGSADEEPLKPPPAKNLQSRRRRLGGERGRFR